MCSVNLYWTLTFFSFLVTGCDSISAFVSLVGIPIGIASSAVWLKTCAITTWIKNFNSIIKEKEKETW